LSPPSRSDDDGTGARISSPGRRTGTARPELAGAYKGLQFTWKKATGKEPPLGPDDQQAPLGHAIAWALVMGAAITTARMIVIRYTSRLLPGGQQQDMTETAAATLADNPDSSTA
jgi:hypothetical protein